MSLFMHDDIDIICVCCISSNYSEVNLLIRQYNQSGTLAIRDLAVVTCASVTASTYDKRSYYYYSSKKKNPLNRIEQKENEKIILFAQTI